MAFSVYVWSVILTTEGRKNLSDVSFCQYYSNTGQSFCHNNFFTHR